MSSLNTGVQTAMFKRVEARESTLREVTSSFGPYEGICTKRGPRRLSDVAVDRLN